MFEVKSPQQCCLKLFKVWSVLNNLFQLVLIAFVISSFHLVSPLNRPIVKKRWQGLNYQLSSIVHCPLLFSFTITLAVANAYQLQDWLCESVTREWLARYFASFLKCSIAPLIVSYFLKSIFKLVQFALQHANPIPHLLHFDQCLFTFMSTLLKIAWNQV